MKYKCTPCDNTFEVSEGQKPRCPRCMGIHNIEPVSSPGAGGSGESSGAKKKSPLVPVIVVLLAAGAVGLYFMLRDEGDGSSPEPESASDLRAALEQLGVDKGDIVIPFEGKEQIAKAAEEIVDGAEGEEALEKIFAALGKMRKENKWEPSKRRTPLGTGSRSAADLFAAMEKGEGGPTETTSYETALLMLAMARAAEVEDAYMAQIFSFEGEKTPADPEGKLGRYGVVLGKGDEKNAPPLFDPWAQRSGKSAVADMKVLPDEEAVAPFYSHRAISRLTEYATAKAHEDVDIAIKLAPGSALFRCLRGLIFMTSGSPIEEAIAEYEKALKTRDDAEVHTNLAEVLILASSNPYTQIDPGNKRAETEIQQALTKMPDYARAHALLAMVYVMRGDFETAEPELALAERLEPDSPQINMMWAQYYAAQGDGEAAIARGKNMVKLSGESLESLIGLAGLYMSTARFDEMRKTLDKILAQNDSVEIGRAIKRMFRYDPDLEPEEEEADGEELADNDYDGGMRLELDTQKGGLGGGLKLGEGLMGGSPGLGAPGLGGGSENGPSLGGGLKLDLNMGQ